MASSDQAEQAQARVQGGIKSFVSDIDLGHLRRMERTMHECAAVCCADDKSSINQVHACVEKCQDKVQRAQSFVQSELERFQGSLSRCVLQCQDNVKDRITPNSSEQDVTKLRNEFELCSVACCDTNVARLPGLKKKVMETLKSGSY